MAGRDVSVPLSSAHAPVVFFANGIGDALMALPALRALCRLFPDRLTLVTRAASYTDILSRLPLRQCLSIRSGGRSAWEDSESDRLAASVGLCDLFVSLVSWHSASLAYLRDALQATATIGFDASFDVALPRIYTKHTSKLMFDAVLAIDASLRFDKFLSPRPPYSQHARDTARAIKGPLRAGLKLVAVHTETTAAKTWPAAQWGRVLHGFLKPRPEWIALLVDYQRQLPTLADADTEAQVVDATGLPLEEALCLVQHADLFVGVDSSMLHAADFGDVPSVGLFISTSAREFGFLLAPHVAIEAASAEAIDCNRVAEAIDAVTVNSAMRSIVRV